MKVFVAGATGVIGRRAVARLVAGGHDVTAAARSPAKAAQLDGLGATPVELDLFDADSVHPAVAGCDAVCNLATHIPSPSKAMLPGAWKENHRVRAEVSRNLVDAALSATVGRYVQESIVFLYAPRGDEWIDEDGPLQLTAILQSAVAAEHQAARFADAGRVGIVLRFGLFYGTDSSHTIAAVKAARRGLASSFGDPRGYASAIQLDDAAAAVSAALSAPSGIYNVVDDEPLSRGAQNEVLAAAVGRRKLTAPPGAVVKLGGNRTEVLARSQRVANRRFKDATGWRPQHRSVREGWPATVAAMDG